MKQTAMPLFLLLAGCAPKLDLAGTLTQLNIGYSQIPIPSEERPAAQLKSYSTRDLALWLTPERADDIETGSVSSSAPLGNVMIELVEIPQVRAKNVCETASNSFIGTDQSVQGKPLVNVFSGYRQVLYRTADAGGGCRQETGAPLGFAAPSSDTAADMLRAYRDAVQALPERDRVFDPSTNYLSSSRIVSATPCVGDTKCLSFRLAPSQAAPDGWEVTYRYGLLRRTSLNAVSPPPAF
ncbi:hypothetical protein [Brevundimonas sp. C43]|uniref:hypothetical protein n=1 Tax=Brevundimonas sp. C43 TaxID=3068314 RepID=UPI00273D429B|nr:hypothetical protein [Brevundimonas sp. C43]